MRLDPRLHFAVLSILIATACPAWAQSDSRAMADRMDRLERDMNVLQSQVYRSQGGSSVITSPALGGGGTASAPAPTQRALNGDAYSILDQRISAIEQQMRDLTNQVEKANLTANQLSAKLDRMQADNDVRLKDLEQRGGGGPGAAPSSNSQRGAVGPGTTNEAADEDAAPPPASSKNPTSGSLVHPPGASAAAAKGPATATAPALAGKTPQEQYDYAFTLLRNADSDGATRAFQAFVAQHPQDPLAGNAMYWLGQIPYSQSHWDQAAPLFLNAYSKYPKSAKAGESLLKLGLSMSNLNKKKEACAALTRFTSEYPDAADNLKRTAKSEKSKLKC